MNVSAASLPSLLFSVILFFTLPESFHFLITKRRTKELSKWLDAVNRVSRNPRLDLTAEGIIAGHHKYQESSEQEGKSRGIICELFKRRILLAYTLILGYLWSV
jgi:hypothetical protein